MTDDVFRMFTVVFTDATDAGVFYHKIRQSPLGIVELRKPSCIFEHLVEFFGGTGCIGYTADEEIVAQTT